MASIYQRMAGTASRLLERYNQGVIEYVPLIAGATEYDPMISGDPIQLNAVARGVSSEYVDDMVSSSDLMIVCSNPSLQTVAWNDALVWDDAKIWSDLQQWDDSTDWSDIDTWVEALQLSPSADSFEVRVKAQGRIRIDGVEKEIIQVRKNPSAGDIVTLNLFVKG